MMTRLLCHTLRAACNLALAAAALPSVPSTLVAQQKVTLPSTDQFTITSKTNGVDYRIDVWLPPGLDTLKVRPSVFYVTDGNPFFPLISFAYQSLNLSGTFPPLILVGVGYPDSLPGMSPFIHLSRTRDYTPTRGMGPLADSAGRSAAFLSFLKSELIPLVEARYRADPAARGIGGHSLGGLFSTYVLTHEPTLFTRYWIGSPSLWWDNRIAFTWLRATAKGNAQPSGRAFVTVGSLETDVMVPPMRELSAKLRTTFPSLHVGSRIYEGETHVSVVGGAATSAIRFLYGDLGRLSIALTPAQRAGFVGKWRTSSGKELEISPAGATLSVTVHDNGQAVSAPLLAESRDVLYSRAVPVNIVAERDTRGTIVRIRSALAGPEEAYERVK